MIAIASLLSAQKPSSATSKPEQTKKYYSVPANWAGEWDGVTFTNPDPTFPKDLITEPAPDQTDQMIISHLQPSALAKREATPYDDSPGSLCDPEGWFPFINYNYGFALLDSPGKITLVPVEPETQGIRRIYFKPAHSQDLVPTWNGESIARWDGGKLIVDTVGYNALSWLGDDREPHSTELHVVEEMHLIRDDKYLQIKTQISDPKTLKSPYTLTRYFERYNTSHLGAGPSQTGAELVCNEDPSPFIHDTKTVSPKTESKK